MREGAYDSGAGDAGSSPGDDELAALAEEASAAVRRQVRRRLPRRRQALLHN